MHGCAIEAIVIVISQQFEGLLVGVIGCHDDERQALLESCLGAKLADVCGVVLEICHRSCDLGG
eukprot:scaffold115951_cov36-Tisochrysis_lutea.AAC.3